MTPCVPIPSSFTFSITGNEQFSGHVSKCNFRWPSNATSGDFEMPLDVVLDPEKGCLDCCKCAIAYKNLDDTNHSSN